ncbi:hypothetical protein [Polyangium aurulentum]|uniref:AlkZ-related protein n=1 Tax=Polyangium aurulentum TaxID=2567896 RepID=UPI0010AE43CA|nr:hypothetical protein [Polyangium aurulentum]UQA60318.1 hypothetical protein E8A73_007535 [Polyangium aurulentum]
MSKALEKAIAAVERRGILLVFPIANRPEPRSLWSELHPRTVMRWQWDENGNPKVHALWHLREELARSRRVVYSKWFKNRATLFSKPVFRAMLGELLGRGDLVADLGREARMLLDILEDDSPQSTKALRRASGLPDNRFQAQLKALWSRHLIVGVGEVDDGSFPSLAVGATHLLFEEDWNAASRGVSEADRAALSAALEGSKAFAKEHARVRDTIQPEAPMADVIYGPLEPRRRR